MKSKLFLTVLVVLMLVVTMVGGAGVVLAEAGCDPAFVSQTGNVITVKPTGVEDTANIQCAFDLAVAAGPGVEVTLTEGTFYTAQIVVNDFHGDFSGAGAEKTMIYNVQNMYVTPVDFYMEPPSAVNPWPSLFSFIDGKYQIFDLGIFVTGDATTAWTIWGIDPPMFGLMFGIGIFGTHADVVVRDISIEGEIASHGFFNLGNGVYMWGWIGESSPPISGSLLIERSTFNTMHYGTPVANWLDVSALITSNTYTDNMFAMDGYDLEESTLIFAQNKVTFEQNNPMPRYGVAFYNIALPEITGSTFLFKNNQFEGTVGIDFEPILGNENICIFLGNNVQKVSDYPLFLGSGTHDCKVIGGNPKTNVIDLGANNILTGVNNMGTGVGPILQHFVKP